VVHRDLNRRNFLLDGDHGKTVKLADFSLAVPKPCAGSRLQGCFGTAPYMSPEMAGQRGHNCATDVWSLGAVCYTLLLDSYPYLPWDTNQSRIDAVKESIVKGGMTPPSYVRLDVAEKLSQEVVAFLKELLNRDPIKRITATEALELPFMAFKI